MDHTKDECMLHLKGQHAPFSPLASKVKYSQRRGVPGHVAYKYSMRGGLAHWAGSSFQAVFTSVMFWVHVAWFAAVTLSIIFLPYSDQVRGFAIKEHIGAITAFILTFFVSQSYSRWNDRFENVCRTNGDVTRLSAVAAAVMPKADAQVLLRYANTIMHIYYFLLSGPMDGPKWELFHERGLLTYDEIALLKKRGSPGAVVYKWMTKIIVKAVPRDVQSPAFVSTLEESMKTFRGLAAKQIAYHLTQIPFIYFHGVCFVVNAYLACTSWNAAVDMYTARHLNCDDYLSGRYGTGSTGTCVAQLVFVCISQAIVILVFTALFQVGCRLSEWNGSEIYAYDLGFDLDNLWQESKNVLDSLEDMPLPYLELDDSVARDGRWIPAEAGKSPSPPAATPSNSIYPLVREDTHIVPYLSSRSQSVSEQGKPYSPHREE